MFGRFGKQLAHRREKGIGNILFAVKGFCELNVPIILTILVVRLTNSIVLVFLKIVFYVTGLKYNAACFVVASAAVMITPVRSKVL